LSLQTKILKEYRQSYPNHTLRETACHTGIQLTRVFRLMNGSPMKLEEFEQFSEALQKSPFDNAPGEAFLHVSREAQKTLNANELSKVQMIIERHLQWHNLVHGTVKNSAVDQNIA